MWDFFVYLIAFFYLNILSIAWYFKININIFKFHETGCIFQKIKVLNLYSSDELSLHLVFSVWNPLLFRRTNNTPQSHAPLTHSTNSLSIKGNTSYSMKLLNNYIHYKLKFYSPCGWSNPEVFVIRNTMSACEIGSQCGENFGWKKGLEISSNRLYAPLLLKKFWLKNHAFIKYTRLYSTCICEWARGYFATQMVSVHCMAWYNMHFWYSLYMTLSVCLSVGTSGPDVTFGTACMIFYLSVCLSVGTSGPQVTFGTACVVFYLFVCRD